jgi:hypothetical protein
MQKKYIFHCLGAPWPPFFSYFASKTPETLAVWASTTRFSGRTVPVSCPKLWGGGGGGVSCNLAIKIGQDREFKDTRTHEQLSRSSDRERERESRQPRKRHFQATNSSAQRSTQSCKRVVWIGLCGSIQSYGQDHIGVHMVHMERLYNPTSDWTLPAGSSTQLGVLFWYPCSAVF